ncbi:MAG: 1-acyl-sn-glycerol-3-phosphate acyltransferase [Gammaproteobacteria bacterium]|nr:MAG: 1-acyl-sn-glycerol-3-phosphate acyltransferase [Gammaproteobacteria bacterium]
MLVLRSLAFGLGMVLCTLVIAPLVVLLAPFPLVVRDRLVSAWAAFGIWWLAVCCRLVHQVDGLENIPEQPCLVLSKHESAWETISLQLFFHPHAWVLKRELFWLPLFGWALATMKPIAIDRGSGRRAVEQVVTQGLERLKSRFWVIIFPEGTRVAPGTRRRFRMGGALLAQKAGCQVVPVAHNAGDFWPRNSVIKYPGTIRIVIGPPINTAGLDAEQINRAAEDWIEATVQGLRTGPLPACQPNAGNDVKTG